MKFLAMESLPIKPGNGRLQFTTQVVDIVETYMEGDKQLRFRGCTSVRHIPKTDEEHQAVVHKFYLQILLCQTYKFLIVQKVLKNILITDKSLLCNLLHNMSTKLNSHGTIWPDEPHLTQMVYLTGTATVFCTKETLMNFHNMRYIYFI